MKSKIILLIAIIIIAGLLVGCSSKEGNTTVSSDEPVGSGVVSSDDKTSSDSNSSETDNQSNIKDQPADNTATKIDPDRFITYMKDGKLLYYNLDDKSVWEALDLPKDMGLFAYPIVDYQHQKMYYTYKSTLYVRDFLSEKAATKIADDVNRLIPAEDGSGVYYATLSNELYYSDYANKTKMDSKIAFLAAVAEDGKGLLYAKESSNGIDIYLCKDKKSKKLVSGTTDFYKTEDISAFYYVKNGELYLYDGSDKKISSGECVIQQTVNNGLYYSVAEGGVNNLYFYNKTKSVKVGEFTAMRGIFENAIVCTLQKNESTDYFVVKDGVKKDVSLGSDMENLNFVSLDISKKNIYFYAASSTTGDNYLYKMPVSGNGVPEQVAATGGYTSQIEFASDGKLIWLTSPKESETASLYIGDKKLADNVSVRTGINISHEKKIMFFFTDWNAESQRGTLWYCKEDGNPVKLAQNVSAHFLTQKGEIIYQSNNEIYLSTFSGQPVKLADKATTPWYARFGYSVEI